MLTKGIAAAWALCSAAVASLLITACVFIAKGAKGNNADNSNQKDNSGGSSSMLSKSDESSQEGTEEIKPKINYRGTSPWPPNSTENVADFNNIPTKIFSTPIEINKPIPKNGKSSQEDIEEIKPKKYRLTSPCPQNSAENVANFNNIPTKIFPTPIKINKPVPKKQNLILQSPLLQDRNNQVISDSCRSSSGIGLQETINKDIAEKILKNHEYTVNKFLGDGANSFVFKCKTPNDEIKAVKVCSELRSNCWAKLPDEIRVANELQDLQTHNPGFAEHMIIPKLVHHGSNQRYAIFEAELANGSALGPFIKNFRNAEAMVKSANSNPDSLDFEELRKVAIDYNELRRVAVDVLQALNTLHSNGKRHGDVKPVNILVKYTSTGNKYFLTDFGTMDSVQGNTNQKDLKRAFKEWEREDDIFAFGQALAILWYYSLGWHDRSVWHDAASRINEGAYDQDFDLYITDPKKKRYGLITLETTSEDKLFLDFCKKLTNTKSRPTAAEALQDPFITNK